MKTTLVCGAGGFIGSHLVKKLVSENYMVRGVDLKFPEFEKSYANEFIIGDLRNQIFVQEILNKQFDEVYQLAADMGGAGFIFTGENDANIMHNSALINLNIVEACCKQEVRKIFYSSSACIYPEHNQLDRDNPICSEESAYPANPDSEYGWEKLFSERLYLSFQRNYKMNIKIARFHNIFGPQGSWNNGREKAPAALCRKVAEVKNGSEIEIWGDGKQTRSFLYIDECLKGIEKLMNCNSFNGPVNIGSEEMVTINQLANIIMNIAGKKLTINHIPGPLGVNGRNSDNKLIKKELNWEPNYPLKNGLEKTYSWVNEQVQLGKE